MAKEGGSFDFSEQIEDINFTIDDTSKYYTIPNYDYWSSSTLINSSYGLNIDKLRKVIEEGKYNKLGVHGLTINWDNAQITINGETKPINTTLDLLKAIQDAGTTVGLNSNGKLRNSEFTSKYNDLLNRINELQNKINNIQPEIEYVNVYFVGDYDSISSATPRTVIKGDKINLPTATKDSDSQYEYSFNGWKNNSTNITYNSDSEVTIYEDTTFTAQFTRYDKSILEVIYDDSMGEVVQLENPQDTNGTHVINGWWFEEDEGTWLYFKAEPENGYSFSHWLYDNQHFTTSNLCTFPKNSGTHILQAVFVDASYIDDTSYTYIGYIGDDPEYVVDYAFYDGNDIEGEWKSAKVGSTITLPNTLSRLQYYDNEVNFYGWICSNGGRTYSGGTNYTFSDNDITGDSYYPDSVGTVKFTAEYEINEYTLSFDVQGGSKSVSNIKQEYNTTITLPSYDGTKNNYSFNGWIINNIRYSAGDNYTITKDVTAYAEWIAKSYLVTFRITNGKIIDGDGISSTQNVAQTFVDYGQTTTWTIEPDEGYKLPTFVTNGRINGNEVTCNIVDRVFECTADCVEEDTSYTYIGDIGDYFDQNGHGYIDLGLPSGTLWASMNIGAGYVTDYGYYFQWGDTQGYTSNQVGTSSGKKAFNWADYKFNPSGDGSTMSKYNDDDGNTVLGFDDDAARANWGGDWHMPTEEQIQELINNTNKELTTLNGVNGCLFTSVNNGNTLFFPAAGNANYGNMRGVGSAGYIWSGSLSSNNVKTGRYLSFTMNGSSAYVNSYERYCGLPIRGVLGY